MCLCWVQIRAWTNKLRSRKKCQRNTTLICECSIDERIPNCVGHNTVASKVQTSRVIVQTFFVQETLPDLHLNPAHLAWPRRTHCDRWVCLVFVARVFRSRTDNSKALFISTDAVKVRTDSDRLGYVNLAHPMRSWRGIFRSCLPK